MNYVIGVAANGERLRFERWLYEAWLRNNVTDRWLVSALQRCTRFYLQY